MEQNKDIFLNPVDYKKLLLRFWEFRKWYVIVGIIFLIVTTIINKYTQPEYTNNTSVLISDDAESQFMSTSGNLMEGMGLFSGNTNIENELELLTSFSLVKKTIDQLNFNIDYYVQKPNILHTITKLPFFEIKRELYNGSPITVILDPSSPQPTEIKFFIEVIDDESFKLSLEGQDVGMYNYLDDRTVNYVDEIQAEGTYKFNEEIEHDYFKFKVLLNKDNFKYFNQDDKLYFEFVNRNYLTYEYLNNLRVDITSESSSIIKIGVKGTNFEKITDFLNQYTSVYLNQNLEKKNKIALSTVKFIDSQISDIADSLSYAESNLKNFRSANKVMDLSFQGQQIFEKMNELESEKATLMVQKRYYNYIEDYFKNNEDVSDMLAPSSMNVVDPILTNMIFELVAFNAERASILQGSGQKSLYLNSIEAKIDNLKKTIRENVNNNLNTLNVSIKEIDYRINKLSNEISRLPKTELQLLGIERKFKLNDAIYTFLLQKRSEAQIARASNTPDYEVVDPARDIITYQTKPKVKLNYIIAIFLTLIFPSAFILIKDYFNDKVTDKKDIESITDIPILGHVFHNFRKNVKILAEQPKSSVSESFRAVRTNFQFFSRGKTKQVILVTSSFSGEGKTFCSINLATAFALIGKRTLLMEFDLRRPKVNQEFGSSNMLGISSYLINKAILEDVIQPTAIENLDLVTAGPIPPNPVELIGSDKTMEMIEKLKEIYDYIIIDSAPVGVVTESFLLMKYSEVNIYVVRQDYTIKELLTNSLKNIKKNNISNLAILINDVNAKRDAYKYGYDTKYYTEKEENDNFFSRIFKSKNSKAS